LDCIWLAIAVAVSIRPSIAKPARIVASVAGVTETSQPNSARNSRSVSSLVKAFCSGSSAQRRPLVISPRNVLTRIA
jgi:hypothetical protein